MKKLFVMLSVMMINGFGAAPGQDDAGRTKTPLDHMREIDQKEIETNTGLPDNIKNNLLLKLKCTLSNPDVSAETAYLVLKDCIALLVNCRCFLDEKCASLSSTVETIISAKAGLMNNYNSELFLIHNLCLHYGLIYYQGDIPQGVLEVFPESRESDKNLLPRLVHLRTPYGPAFLSIPFVEPVDTMRHSYIRELAMFPDRKIRDIDLVYSGNTANHSSGFYCNLDNGDGYPVAFGAYIGAPGYRMGGTHIVSHLDRTQDVLGVVLEQEKPLIFFAMSQLAEKIGGFEKLKGMRKVGELVFLPFPIAPDEQAEAAYAEDLFQAQEAMKDLQTTTFLLGMIGDPVDDIAKQSENDEKRAKILAKKRQVEARLAAFNAEYQTTTATLISTIEGKLLSLHETEYQQMIADDQKKISNQLISRSQSGIMSGKKLSCNEKAKAKEANEAEKKRLKGELAVVQKTVRESFLSKIKTRHNDYRHVLKSFHEHLAQNGIKFHETQDGAHRVTHTEGATAVTVVEEHKGSAPFAHYSGKVIRHMLNIFGDALQQKQLTTTAV